MIRGILEHIGGIAIFPIVALLLFVAVFVGFAVWAFTMSRAQVDHASRLPLEPEESTQGDVRHE